MPARGWGRGWGGVAECTQETDRPHHLSLGRRVKMAEEGIPPGSKPDGRWDLFYFFQRVAEATPAATALVAEDGGTVSFGQLQGMAEELDMLLRLDCCDSGRKEHDDPAPSFHQKQLWLCLDC